MLTSCGETLFFLHVVFCLYCRPLTISLEKQFYSSMKPFQWAYLQNAARTESYSSTELSLVAGSESSCIKTPNYSKYMPFM